MQGIQGGAASSPLLPHRHHEDLCTMSSEFHAANGFSFASWMKAQFPCLRFTQSLGPPLLSPTSQSTQEHEFVGDSESLASPPVSVDSHFMNERMTGAAVREDANIQRLFPSTPEQHSASTDRSWMQLLARSQELEGQHCTPPFLPHSLSVSSSCAVAQESSSSSYSSSDHIGRYPEGSLTSSDLHPNFSCNLGDTSSTTASCFRQAQNIDPNLVNLSHLSSSSSVSSPRSCATASVVGEPTSPAAGPTDTALSSYLVVLSNSLRAAALNISSSSSSVFFLPPSATATEFTSPSSSLSASSHLGAQTSPLCDSVASCNNSPSSFGSPRNNDTISSSSRSNDSGNPNIVLAQLSPNSRHSYLEETNLQLAAASKFRKSFNTYTPTLPTAAVAISGAATSPLGSSPAVASSSASSKELEFQRRMNNPLTADDLRSPSNSATSARLLSTSVADPWRKHKCSYCAKGFCSRSAVERHERTHTGEAPFPCLLCGKRFKQKGTLQDHQRVHSEGKSFECPYHHCGKRFRHRSSLHRHMEKCAELRASAANAPSNP